MAYKTALLVVDVQNDFLPGGALGVPSGDLVIPVLNRYIERFRNAGLPVYTSRDWHPAVSKHFKEYGGIWPPHCIQDSWGAQFHPELIRPPGRSWYPREWIRIRTATRPSTPSRRMELRWQSRCGAGVSIIST